MPFAFRMFRLGCRRAGMAQNLAPNFSFKHGRQQSRNCRTDRLAGGEDTVARSPLET